MGFDEAFSAHDVFGVKWIEAVRTHALQMLLNGRDEMAHADTDPIDEILAAVAEEL